MAVTVEDLHAHSDQAMAFFKHHPRLTCSVLLLLLTPPLLRILLYFTPLLFSTALCVFALISMSPYIIATDAEVQRESTLRSSSSSSSPAAAAVREVESAFKDRSHKLAASSSLPPSDKVLGAAPDKGDEAEAASSADTAKHSSWLGWMKGLNDMGRSWMEKRLKEEGLALSDPANRDTLLALLQASFPEFTAPSPESRSIDNLAEFGYDGYGSLEPKPESGSTVAEPVEASDRGSLFESERADTAHLKEVGTNSLTKADCKVEQPEGELLKTCSPCEAPTDQAEEEKHALGASCETRDQGKDTVQSSSVTCKEGADAEKIREDSSNLLGRADVPLKKSVLFDVIPPTAMQEARKRSQVDDGMAGDGGWKGKSQQSSSKVGSSMSRSSSITDVDEGPKFDDDLEVEEAQALVRSELLMLEMEIEEVASKLNTKLLSYDKTPSSKTPTSKRTTGGGRLSTPLSSPFRIPSFSLDK